MAEFIEHFFGVNFHEIHVLDEEPEMPVKRGGVDGVDDRHERGPIFVAKAAAFLT
jgi:hypothetical protein